MLLLPSASRLSRCVSRLPNERQFLLLGPQKRKRCLTCVLPLAVLFTSQEFWEELHSAGFRESALPTSPPITEAKPSTLLPRRFCLLVHSFSKYYLSRFQHFSLFLFQISSCYLLLTSTLLRLSSHKCPVRVIPPPIKNAP
jgi:hypothetical protein